MGLAYADVVIDNPLRTDLRPVGVRALAETGAVHLCLPQHVALQLDLAERERREVTLADGGRQIVAYVGPVRVRFENRSCFVGAIVLGDEVLLGAIPMEDLDLVVRPLTREVTVNPLSPNVPTSSAKAAHPGATPSRRATRPRERGRVGEGASGSDHDR